MALPGRPASSSAAGRTDRRPTPALLQRHIQDTLDLIEFANGRDATWGGKRAGIGHPGRSASTTSGSATRRTDPQFFANFLRSATRSRRATRTIKVISNIRPTTGRRDFDRTGSSTREQGVDMVDEHYYNSPNWFLDNAPVRRLRPRRPEVFLGEYARAADWTTSCLNALAEAAYMTGLERNADVVEARLVRAAAGEHRPRPVAPDIDLVRQRRVLGHHELPGAEAVHEQRRRPGGAEPGSTRPTHAAADHRGGIGVSTWATPAAYDDVRVTGRTATVLFTDDFAAAPSSGRRADRAGRPAARGPSPAASTGRRRDLTDARSIAGNPSWSNYTLELSARKLGGDEGFLIMFGSRDSSNFYWWNLGGFGNTQSLIEKATGGAKTSIAASTDTITTGQTYRIKIEVKGRRIVTWLDGRKVHDFVDNSNVVEPLYQVMTRDEDSGEVVLKVVNARARGGPHRRSGWGTPARRHRHGHDAHGGRADGRELVRRADQGRAGRAPGRRARQPLHLRLPRPARSASCGCAPPGLGSPPQPGSPGPGAPGVDRTVRIRSTRLRADRRRRVAVRIACGPTAGLRCRGVLQLRRSGKVIGGRSFSVRAGRAATVRVRVSRAAYRRLSRRRSTRVTVTLRTRGSDGRLRRVSARLGLRR